MVPKVTVELRDLDKVCRCCGRVKDDVKTRTYYGRNYEGSCGDSFCYASCDLTSCKGVTARVCKDCEDAKIVPPK